MPNNRLAARLLSRALYTAIIDQRPDYTPGAASKMADALAANLVDRTDLFTVVPREEATVA